MQKIPAAFIRGGTSKGVFFHEKDLPKDKHERDQILLKILGSPDPYQRQMDGLGGGYSSVSKAAIISVSERDDADIDYTFAQVAVDKRLVDYSANCGNLSSAVGPFAIDEGLVKTEDSKVTIKVFNTNTQTFFNSTFEVKNNKAITHGSFEIPGIANTGAKIKLDFLNPDGATTGKLLPTGNAIDILLIPKLGDIEVSIVDSSNLLIFVNANTLNTSCNQLPDDIQNNKSLMEQLEVIRKHAALHCGYASSLDTVPLANPKIAIIDTVKDFQTLDNKIISSEKFDIAIRMLSMGKVHKAVTLTGAMCLSTACFIEGTIPNQLINNSSKEDILIGNPSGILPVKSEVANNSGIYKTESTTVYRTQRRLMDGYVYID